MFVPFLTSFKICVVSLRPAKGLEMGDKKRNFSPHFKLDLLFPFFPPSLSDESDMLTSLLGTVNLFHRARTDIDHRSSSPHFLCAPKENWKRLCVITLSVDFTHLISDKYGTLSENKLFSMLSWIYFLLFRRTNPSSY